MLNTLFDVLGRTINTEYGLEKLTIKNFYDKNCLQEWPLEQLTLKSPHLQFLQIYDLRSSTPANRSLILEFAAKTATKSSCLHTLLIKYTCSSAEELRRKRKALQFSY